MTSILEVEQLDTLSSNASSTLTIGGTNATTLDLGSNITGGSITMLPGFYAKASSNQTSAASNYVKVVLDTEIYDSHNAFDNTTNYRFTVPSGQAGKYFFFSQVNAGGAIQTNDYVFSLIYKNGSELNNTRSLESCESNGRITSVNSTIVDDASVGDYYELYFYTDLRSMTMVAQYSIYFGAYRLIGA